MFRSYREPVEQLEIPSTFCLQSLGGFIASSGADSEHSASRRDHYLDYFSGHKFL